MVKVNTNIIENVTYRKCISSKGKRHVVLPHKNRRKCIKRLDYIVNILLIFIFIIITINK